MKKFLIQILIFTVLLTIGAFALDYSVTQGLRKTGSGEVRIWNDIYNQKINSDVIISGSSRVWTHISPQILDSVLNINSYGLGLSGATMEIMYYQYKFFEKYNKSPRLLIVNTDFATLTNRIGLKRPFMAYVHEEVLRGDLKRIGFSNFEIYLPAFQYHSAKLDIIRGLLEFFNIKHFTETRYKGYLGIKKVWNGSELEKVMRSKDGIEIQIQEKMVSLLDSFLYECKQKNIQVVMVFTPLYYQASEFTKNKNEVLKIYNSFSQKYDFPFLNYITDSMSYDTTYFFNAMHLNKKGAELFTEKLAHDIDSLGILGQSQD